MTTRLLIVRRAMIAPGQPFALDDFEKHYHSNQIYQTIRTSNDGALSFLRAPIAMPIPPAAIAHEFANLAEARAWLDDPANDFTPPGDLP